MSGQQSRYWGHDFRYLCKRPATHKKPLHIQYAIVAATSPSSCFVLFCLFLELEPRVQKPSLAKCLRNTTSLPRQSTVAHAKTNKECMEEDDSRRVIQDVTLGCTNKSYALSRLASPPDSVFETMGLRC